MIQPHADLIRDYKQQNDNSCKKKEKGNRSQYVHILRLNTLLLHGNLQTKESLNLRNCATVSGEGASFLPVLPLIQYFLINLCVSRLHESQLLF